MAKEMIVSTDDGYKILRTQKDGTEKVQATLHGIARTETGKAIGMMVGMIAKEADKQGACLSLLCDVLDGSIKDLQQFSGTGDKKKGQLSEGVKDAFRKAEDVYFDAMLKTDHPQHNAYIKGLPKVNIDGDKLPDAVGERHAYFKTRMRKDPSYANAKNLALNLWHFCGLHPMDEETGQIRPPQVMRVLINNAKDAPEAGPSFADKLCAQLRELYLPADPKNPPAIADTELAKLMRELKAATEGLQERINSAAARATKAAETLTSVKGQADAAIGEAKDKAPEPALM